MGGGEKKHPSSHGDEAGGWRQNAALMKRTMRTSAAAMAAPSGGSEKVKCSQAMADGSKMQWEADRQEERSNHIDGERGRRLLTPRICCSAP